MPLLLVLARELSYILFKLTITINQKNVSSLWKFYQTHSHNLHFGLTGFSSVQFSCSVEFDSVTPWTAARQASLSITSSWRILKLMSIVGDAIQPSHPLLSPFPPAFNLSQHWGLFKWVSYLHQVAKVLEFLLQHQFSHIQDWFALGRTGWISLQSKGISRVFSNTTVQKHQFFGAQISLWSNSQICTWLLGKPSLD